MSQSANSVLMNQPMNQQTNNQSIDHSPRPHACCPPNGRISNKFQLYNEGSKQTCCTSPCCYATKEQPNLLYKTTREYRRFICHCISNAKCSFLGDPWSQRIGFQRFSTPAFHQVSSDVCLLTVSRFPRRYKTTNKGVIQKCLLMPRTCVNWDDRLMN